MNFISRVFSSFLEGATANSFKEKFSFPYFFIAFMINFPLPRYDESNSHPLF